MPEDKKMTVAERKRLEALDRKIERLQGKVSKAHREYEDLVEQLALLIEERYPEKKEERIKESLYKAYQASDWSLEEVLSFLDGTFEDRFGF